MLTPETSEKLRARWSSVPREDEDEDGALRIRELAGPAGLADFAAEVWSQVGQMLYQLWAVTQSSGVYAMWQPCPA